MRLWLLACLVLPWAVGCACSSEGVAPDAGPLETGECREHSDCPRSEVCEKEPGAERGSCVPFHCDGPNDAALCEGDGCWCDVETRTCRCPTTCLPGEPNGCDEGELCLLTSGHRMCVPPEELPAASGCEAWPPIVHQRELSGTPVWLSVVDERGSPVPYGSCAVSMVAPEPCSEDVCVSDVPVPCAAEVCVVERRVYPALPADVVRVVVVEEGSGSPIASARVLTRSGDIVHEAFTDERGIARFADVSSVDSVTVLPEAHDWRTLVGDARDVLVATRKRALPGAIAAAVATGDFREVTTQGDIKLMLAGVSFDPLTQLSAQTLFGEEEERTLFLEGATPPEGAPMTLPSAMSVSVASESVKGEALLVGGAGRRLPWALAGRARLSQVSDLLLEEQPSGAALLEQVLAKADHGLGPTVILAERPRGASLVPYDAVASAALTGEDALPLDTLAMAHVDVSAPLLPCPPSARACAPDESEESLLVLALAHVAGRGYVPLGMYIAHDDPNPGGDAPSRRDSVVEATDALGEPLPAGQVRLAFAPPHDGLEGARLSFAALSRGPILEGVPSVTAAVLPRTSPDQAVSFGRELLPYPRATVAGDTVTLDDVGGQLARLELRAHELTWRVWVSSDAGVVELARLLPDDVALPTGTLSLTGLALDRADASPEAAFALERGGLLLLERDLRAFAIVGCGEGSSCVVE